MTQDRLVSCSSTDSEGEVWPDGQGTYSCYYLQSYQEVLNSFFMDYEGYL